MLIVPLFLVALRKESVDRNSNREINICIAGVALRKESVDRNLTWYILQAGFCGRSPQGERG